MKAVFRNRTDNFQVPSDERGNISCGRDRDRFIQFDKSFFEVSSERKEQNPI